MDTNNFNQGQGPQVDINLDNFAKMFNKGKRGGFRRGPKQPKTPKHGVPDYGKLQVKSLVGGLVAALVIILFCFLILLIPFNPMSVPFWFMMIFAIAAFVTVRYLIIYGSTYGYEHMMPNEKISYGQMQTNALKLYLVPGILLAFAVALGFASSTIFHAKAYSSILTVQEAVFADDLEETLNNDSIALMDTKSAKMLGDREIGSLASVVSQYNVSDDYTQIDFNGKPKKVAALDYVGFFKWLANKSIGVPGYVMVDPVSMSASYKQCDQGMIYVPSAYILQDAERHIRLHYPTALTGNLHFEVDEEGHPYYIASTYTHTILLFGGSTVNGAIIMDPTNGAVERYALADVPTWADDVYDGNVICEQYNWFGTLKNGFLNSLIAKKGCNQVTQYRADDNEDEDEVPVSDYGYVAKDGDIWIYTGITSVNGDSSNIGFLLANERTGEAHYYNIAGADERSAMAAAEGEVQEKRYQASFPSLINVDGNPTYIMVLKDASGLVKLFATVNVEQYNLVTTATSQKECISKYRALLGLESISDGDPDKQIDEEAFLEPTGEADVTVADMKYIDINGNTYIYIITDDQQIYKAKAASHEDMLLIGIGDSVHITFNENTIISCTR